MESADPWLGSVHGCRPLVGLPPTALLLPHACFADSYAPYATAAPMTGSLAQSCLRSIRSIHGIVNKLYGTAVEKKQKTSYAGPDKRGRMTA